MKALLLFIIVLSGLFGCNNNRDVNLCRQENDSLRLALNDHNAVVEALQEVGMIIDSIDQNRKILRVNMFEGTMPNDNAARLVEINGYVIRSEKKIAALESKLKKSNREGGIYMDMINVLRTEIYERLEEIYALEHVNLELEQKVKVQESDLKATFVELHKKEDALASQNLKAQQIANKLKLSEAEVFFAKGSALEETASRIRFAPHKKKATLIEAVGNYRKAAELGKKEASARLEALRGKY
jgi:hypothetical protein